MKIFQLFFFIPQTNDSIFNFFNTFNLDHENICKTTSGPSSDVPCVFPFKFRGEIHNECNWDGDASDGAWCSTLIDDSGQHVGGKGNWGNCGPKCPIPPSSKDIASDRDTPKKGISFQ